MARGRFASRRPPPWRPPPVESAAQVDQRRESLAQFLRAHGRPPQKGLSMQGQSPYDSQHTVVFRRGGGAIRMTRAEAAKAVQSDQNLSFDAWGPGTLRDPDNLVDIPFRWEALPDSEMRLLATALRLPPGSRGEPCVSHSTTILDCLTWRARARWNAAMSCEV